MFIIINIIELVNLKMKLFLMGKWPLWVVGRIYCIYVSYVYIQSEFWTITLDKLFFLCMHIVMHLNNDNSGEAKWTFLTSSPLTLWVKT